MAIRTHRLHHRITGMGGNTQQVMASATPMGQQHPSGTAATPMVMPIAQVLVYPAAVQGYSVIAYHELVPIWAPGGEAIPASMPGRWGQLAAAGRP
jgi:hypothetical protein